MLDNFQQLKGANENKKIIIVRKNNDVNEIAASVILFALCSALIIVFLFVLRKFFNVVSSVTKSANVSIKNYISVHKK